MHNTIFIFESKIKGATFEENTRLEHEVKDHSKFSFWWRNFRYSKFHLPQFKIFDDIFETLIDDVSLDHLKNKIKALLK